MPRIRRRDPSRWPRGTLYPPKLAMTSPTSVGRSVGIVHSRNQATEFFYILRNCAIRYSSLGILVGFKENFDLGVSDTYMHIFLKEVCSCLCCGSYLKLSVFDVKAFLEPLWCALPHIRLFDLYKLLDHAVTRYISGKKFNILGAGTLWTGESKRW
jgi:hypothetical protein